MRAEERRKKIVSLLLEKASAVSGSRLAEHFGVSRQIIVQDISILKAMGIEILATHSGYVIQASPFCERVFKVHHTSEETENELNLIVEHGGTVVDVFVWHKVYGKMEAKLNISTKEQVQQMIEGVRSGKSVELMTITGGYHYHTIRADSEQIMQEIEHALHQTGYIAPEI